MPRAQSEDGRYVVACGIRGYGRWRAKLHHRKIVHDQSDESGHSLDGPRRGAGDNILFSRLRSIYMDTVHVILLITTLVLGLVATTLWGPDFEWLGHDVETLYIFKMAAIGLVVFFLIAITFGLI